jgi:hypothetical protein
VPEVKPKITFPALEGAEISINLDHKKTKASMRYQSFGLFKIVKGYIIG